MAAVLVACLGQVHKSHDLLHILRCQRIFLEIAGKPQKCKHISQNLPIMEAALADGLIRPSMFHFSKEPAQAPDCECTACSEVRHLSRWVGSAIRYWEDKHHLSDHHFKSLKMQNGIVV